MAQTLTPPQSELLLALDASGTGLWSRDLRTQSVTWTPMCYRLYGVPEDGTPLTFADFMQRVHPEDRARVAEELAHCERHGQPLHSEFRILRPDGSVRWLVATGNCTQADEGTPAKMSGSLRDITEEVHTRQVLHESQERLRLTVETSGTGLWTWDLATDAVTWSSENYRIHGLQPGGFANTGEAFFALVHPADRQRVEQTVRTALERNQKYESEFRIVRPDGSIAWVTNRGHVRYSLAGQPAGMLGTTLDISRAKQSELAMQAALEASSAGTFRWDIRSNELWWDDALDRLFGLTPGDSVRSLEHFIARVHPDDRAGVLARCERCRTDGADFDMEFRVVWPDGTERWLYDRGRTFRDHQGRPASMTGACVDITHRKHTELALRRSETFYRQALESLPGLTFTTTADGWWDYLSEQWQTYTGIPGSRLLGHSWTAVLHPDDRPAAIALAHASVDKREPYHTEYRLRAADGEYRWFKVRCLPIHGPAGEVASWIGTAVDIDDVKRVEDALAHSEERLRLAQRAGGIGVWEWDIARRVAFWTDHTATLLGVRPDDLSAVSDDAWRDAIHPEDMPHVQAALQDAYATGRFHDEFRTVHADGSQLWLESTGHLVQDEVGATRVVGTVRDVSERRRAEEALRQADRMKDEFLATLAHELRNPLAPLRTGLQLIKRSRGPQDLETTRAMMERQLAHLVRLVDDLLDVARISQGKIEVRREPVPVAAIVEHATEAAREAIERRGHSLAVRDDARGAVVEGDLTRLSQVLSNLLVNAAKFTPEGGDIALDARVVDGGVELAVTDSGIGIAPAVQSRVFDLFMQVGQGWRPGLGGLGIGLSLVRRLVELHGGTVRLHSEGEGRGSTFVVRLPLAASQSAVGAMASEVAGEPVAPIRVMVVDDNTDAAEVMGMMLQLSGHDVRIACDGAGALELAREFRPAVTFLDLGLPGMNGYDVARRFRAEPTLREGMLIALTGWGSEQDKRRTLEAGFDLHLTKPVDPAQVEALLAGPHPHRAGS